MVHESLIIESDIQSINPKRQSLQGAHPDQYTDADQNSEWSNPPK